MQILECRLKHYGKFTDYRITYHPGLNVIEGGNESGKSTVFSFIRSMLYGIRKNRSKDLDEYQLRQPWENPDYFAGAMKVHEGRCIYRIERNFLKKDESLHVINETEGRELDDPEGFLRRITGGLSEEDFINTFYIRQTYVRTDARLGADLRDYLVNMEQAKNSRTDVKSALDALKKKRRDLEAEKKKALCQVFAKIEDNRREAEYVEGEIGRLNGRLEEENRRTEEQSEFVRKTAREQAKTRGQEEAAPPGEIRRLQGRAGRQEARGQIRTDWPMPGRGDGGRGRQTASEDMPGHMAAEYVNAGENGGNAPEYDQLPPVLPVLLFSAAVMAGLCGAFAQGKILEAVLWAAGAAFAAAGLWCLRKMAKRRRRRGSREKLEKAERSVRRYSALNRLLGFRDDSEDPELEAKKRKLELERQKALQAEEEWSRSETAADVTRLLREKSSSHSAVPGQETSSQEQASGRVDAIAGELREKMRRKAQLDRDFEKLSSERDAINGRTLETDAVDMAMKRIFDLSSAIYRESGEDFSRRVSQILSAMTGGRYRSISLDDKLEVNISTPDRLLKLPQVSCGTMDQISLALRIAAGELLSGGADVPLLMDEPFAMYDDERLKDALRFLAGYDHQILLFTCQDREKRLAREVG